MVFLTALLESSKAACGNDLELAQECLCYLFAEMPKNNGDTLVCVAAIIPHQSWDDAASKWLIVDSLVRLRATADGLCFFRCFVASKNPAAWAAVERHPMGEPLDRKRAKQELDDTREFMERYVNYCEEHISAEFAKDVRSGAEQMTLENMDVVANLYNVQIHVHKAASLPARFWDRREDIIVIGNEGKKSSIFPFPCTKTRSTLRVGMAIMSSCGLELSVGSIGTT